MIDYFSVVDEIFVESYVAKSLADFYIGVLSVSRDKEPIDYRIDMLIYTTSEQEKIIVHDFQVIVENWENEKAYELSEEILCNWEQRTKGRQRQAKTGESSHLVMN